MIIKEVEKKLRNLAASAAEQLLVGSQDVVAQEHQQQTLAVIGSGGNTALMASSSPTSDQGISTNLFSSGQFLHEHSSSGQQQHAGSFIEFQAGGGGTFTSAGAVGPVLPDPMNTLNVGDVAQPMVYHWNSGYNVWRNTWWQWLFMVVHIVFLLVVFSIWMCLINRFGGCGCGKITKKRHEDMDVWEQEEEDNRRDFRVSQMEDKPEMFVDQFGESHFVRNSNYIHDEGHPYSNEFLQSEDMTGTSAYQRQMTGVHSRRPPVVNMPVRKVKAEEAGEIEIEAITPLAFGGGSGGGDADHGAAGPNSTPGSSSLKQRRNGKQSSSVGSQDNDAESQRLLGDEYE
ncbi:unnamed protein product [Amoebophrya sp. A120]|nr:unnamed protein product [Amoebophrya sp. A120]|eukprot:GSA120T00007373001.1